MRLCTEKQNKYIQQSPCLIERDNSTVSCVCIGTLCSQLCKVEALVKGFECLFKRGVCLEMCTFAEKQVIFHQYMYVSVTGKTTMHPYMIVCRCICSMEMSTSKHAFYCLVRF